MNALAYLQRKEWTMGNGQCPECYGNQPGKWCVTYRLAGGGTVQRPHPCVPTPAHEGHRPGCDLAAGIAELGGEVQYRTATL